MKRSVSRDLGRPDRGRVRGALAVVSCGLALAATTLVAPPWASAVATAYTCPAMANVVTVDAAGTASRFPLTEAGMDKAVFGRTRALDGDWKGYPTVLAAPGGYFYGINGKGMFLSHLDGSGQQDMPWTSINSSFTSYAAAKRRNDITIDQRGYLYLVDGKGRVLSYHYDTAAKNWDVWSRPLATGWTDVDLLVASGDGVLYARNTAAELYRYAYDPSSHRWLDGKGKRVGSSWDKFTRVAGLGADILLATRDGDLFQYRYDASTNSWPVQKQKVDADGWDAYTSLTAAPDTCKPATSTTPARPAVEASRYAPVGALPRASAAGTSAAVDFAYTNNIGELKLAHQPDQDASAPGTPVTVSGSEAFSGRPALAENPGGTLTVQALNRTGSVWTYRTTTAAQATGSWKDGRGFMPSPTSLVPLEDGSLAGFAVDARGHLFTQRQDGPDGAEAFPWHDLGAPAGASLTGAVVTVPLVPGRYGLVLRDTAGALWYAVYEDDAVGAFTPLGGTGYTDTPAAVVAPGRLVRVVARNADGVLVTQTQTAEGNAWPGTWTPLTLDQPATTGSPAAVLSPEDGRVTVFSRSPDGAISAVQETNQGCGTFGPWWTAGTGDGTQPVAYAADPTAYAVTKSGRAQWGFATYTDQFQLTVFYRESAVVPAPPAGGGCSVQAGTLRSTTPRSQRNGHPAPPVFERRAYRAR